MTRGVGIEYNVKISGPDIRKAIERGLRSEVKVAMRETGREAVKLLKAQSAHINDLGAYRSGWFFKVSGNGITIGNIAGHAVFVENGRRAGATPPPVIAIEGWCERHLGRKDIAWAVARSIGKKGIRTRRVFTNPITERWIIKQLRIRLGKAIDRCMK
jgi:hypothetical protein